MQTHARKKTEPIDSLTFRTNITKFIHEDVTESPKDGLYIYGLSLQGGAWDIKTSLMKEAEKNELTFEMPCIW